MLKEKIRKELRIGYIWRLEKEKGFHIFLDVIRECLKHPEHETTHFYILGKGSFGGDIAALATQDARVHYMGFKNQDEVRASMQTLDALVVPSLFLETFWLVACEAVSLWIPVIGPREWWLKEMIDPSYAIQKDAMRADMIKIFNSLSSWWRWERIEQGRFNHDIWKKNLNEIIWVSKNILIIHDYLKKIWGAEEYLYFLKNELQSEQRTVVLFGASHIQTYFQRVWWFFISFIAFWRYFQVRKILRHQKPDLIWLHTIHRYIWPWGLLALKNVNTPIIMTHHDLWLISPRPSEVFQESEIPKKQTISQWMRQGTSISEKILNLGKYLLVTILWKLLRVVDIHIVPSDFMKPYYQSIWKKEVRVFPHTPFR